MKTTLTSPFTLLKQAWTRALQRSNIFSFLILGAIPQLFSLVISVLIAYFSRFDLLSNTEGWMIAGLILFGLLTLVVMSVVSAWYTALLYHVYQATAAGNLARLTVYIQQAKQVTVRLLITYIKAGIMVSLGFLLLIIPGIIIAVRYMFAPLIATVEDKTVKPIDESKRLVKGRFWKLVGRSLLMIIAYNIPLSVLQAVHPYLGAIWAITSPIFGLYFYLVYMDFKRTASGAS